MKPIEVYLIINY